MDPNRRIDDLRLLELKEWMPLQEAIDRLSSFCTVGEILRRDLLKRALDGSLTLSLYLKKGTRARPCLIINRDEIDKIEFDCVNTDRTLKGYLWESEDKFIKPEDTKFMSELEDCHDLIMAGGVIYELNNMVTQSCGLAAPGAFLGNQTEIFLGSPGVIVKNKNGQVYELMSPSLFSYEKIDGEPDKMRLSFHGNKVYHPMMCLPLHESPLVIRTNELLKLEKLLAVQGSRNTYQDDNYCDQSEPATGQIEPKEEPLRTRMEMAVFLKCSVPSIRDFIKNENLPVHKMDNGRIYAIPLELLEWLDKRGKRKMEKQKRKEKQKER